MKATIFALALAAASVLPSAQAGVLQFNFTATGAGGTTPSYTERTETLFHESGPRQNVVNGTLDEIRDDGNGMGYLIRYATSTYDVAGYYTDYYTFNGDVSGPTGGAQYAYVYGKVTYDPTAVNNVAESAPALDAGMLFTGSYVPAYDPEFPTIPLTPASPFLAIGYSNDRADLVVNSNSASFNNGYFGMTGGAAGIDLVQGDNALEFLFYVGPDMDPGMTILTLSGPAYDLGTYTRTDRVMLSYEPIRLPVPEPTTWAMLLAGVGIVGVARRRKTAA